MTLLSHSIYCFIIYFFRLTSKYFYRQKNESQKKRCFKRCFNEARATRLDLLDGARRHAASQRKTPRSPSAAITKGIRNQLSNDRNIINSNQNYTTSPKKASPSLGKYSSEGAAREWSTVVYQFLFLLPLSNLFHCLCRDLLYSKTPKQVFFNPINIFDFFYHTLFAVF